MSAVKSYRATLNHVFSLTGIGFAASLVALWMFHSFERSRPLWKIRPLNWNLSLVLWCLSWPPFKPLKLASDKHPTWKMFLLALALAKRVSELHGLFFLCVCVHHSRGWRSCTFSFLPDFVV